MLVVLDTNVLVSGLLTPQGNCARLLGLFRSRALLPCYDTRIFLEYERVFSCERLPITETNAAHILNAIRYEGCSVVAKPRADKFPDESDRPFFEVATTVDAPLITGNLRHYPESDLALSSALFLEHFESA